MSWLSRAVRTVTKPVTAAASQVAKVATPVVLKAVPGRIVTAGLVPLEVSARVGRVAANAVGAKGVGSALGGAVESKDKLQRTLDKNPAASGAILAAGALVATGNVAAGAKLASGAVSGLAAQEAARKAAAKAKEEVVAQTGDTDPHAGGAAPSTTTVPAQAVGGPLTFGSWLRQLFGGAR